MEGAEGQRRERVEGAAAAGDALVGGGGDSLGALCSARFADGQRQMQRRGASVCFLVLLPGKKWGVQGVVRRCGEGGEGLTYGGEDHDSMRMKKAQPIWGDAGGEGADHVAHLLEFAEEPHAHGAHEAERCPVGLPDGSEDAGSVDDVPVVTEEAEVPDTCWLH